MIEKMITTSRTTDVHGTTRLIINAYNQSGLSTDRFIPPVMAPLSDKNSKLGEALVRSKAQSILAEKDDKRDYDVRAVGYLLKGYTYYPTQEVRDAAEVVKNIFDKYGFTVTEEGYVSQSSHLVSMLGDFGTPKVQAAISTLPGMAENIAALQASEDDFENTQAEYAEEIAEEDNKPNASALKKEVVKLINDDLVTFLRTGERFQPDTYGAFARTVAKIIADNNEMVKKRRKKDE